MTETPTTVRFPAIAGYLYAKTNLGVTLPPEVKLVAKLTGKSLLELHNLVASNLGKRTTSKFADLAAGQRRTWQLLLDYQASVDADKAGFEASAEELAAQAPRQAVKAAQLSDTDKAQVAEEAATRKAKREPRAGNIRTPRADDGAIRMPTEGGKQRAKRQKDGSYAFRIPATKPRTTTVSDERELLIGLMAGERRSGTPEPGCTWADIKKELGKDDFRTVTSVTMMCISLGYGAVTQPDGRILLLEPLA